MPSPLPAPVRRRRARRLLRAGAPTLAAFGAVLAFAAFTDEVRNDGNEATAASVTIDADRPASTALFDVDDWRPEAPERTRCVTLTSAGSVAVPIRLGLRRPAEGALADHVDVRIEHGGGGSTAAGSCDGFVPGGAVDLDPAGAGTSAELDELPAGAALVPDGAGELAPGARRAYRITWTLQDTEEAEGESVSGVDLVWRSSTGS